jgi:murein DD-endopeptidase MepM/ murein hydrolase activator NlpD
MRRHSKLTRLLFLLAMLLPLFLPAQAQAQYTGPVYVVQEGDTLYSIATYFHTTTFRLANWNYITDANMVVPGRRLTIPGFQDLSGNLTRVTVALGDTPTSLARQSGTDPSAFRRINFLTSEDAIYVGQSVFLLTDVPPTLTRVPVTAGLTDLELAALHGVSPWAADNVNDLGGSWRLVANDTIYLPAAENGGEILPGIISLSGSALAQGKTAQFNATGSGSASLSGTLLDYPLHFYTTEGDSTEALQGVPRMLGQTRNPAPDWNTTAALANLVLTTSDTNGKLFSIQQTLPVKKMEYGYDSDLLVADNTIDPAVTEPEMNFLLEQVAAAPAEKYWSGVFLPPTSTPDAQASTFGRLRSYNGSPYIYYHSGTDYAGGEGVPIYAAADGVVVYAGELTVRGNATILSHGRGVYTGYWHQSKIEVTQGQTVKAGEEIGLIGATGRVTGPHLHFEVLVGSVQVDPEDWLNGLYP